MAGDMRQTSEMCLYVQCCEDKAVDLPSGCNLPRSRGPFNIGDKELGADPLQLSDLIMGLFHKFSALYLQVWLCEPLADKTPIAFEILFMLRILGSQCLRELEASCLNAFSGEAIFKSKGYLNIKR